MRERRGYRVNGRVQGVGYRWWATQRAQELGVGGTVRNREDGAVEVWAEGTEEALTALRRALEEGPPAARVDRVEELEDDGRALPERFQTVR